VSILTEVLRDNFRNSKVKLAALPALGEALFLVATQVSGHFLHSNAITHHASCKHGYCILWSLVKQVPENNTISLQNLVIIVHMMT